jgi:tRNA dimethylallyltransferase
VPRNAPTVFLAGATAVGKTAVAIELALALDAEILSIDSRQAYRRLDIGTAKPTREERARVAHHLLDLFEPGETASAQAFAEHYRAVLADLRARRRRPLAVGGSGLYVDACLDRLDPLPPADPGIRASHARIVAEQGVIALHARLREVDPPSAVRLHPNDIKRISRALEVFELTGRALSELQRHDDHPDLSRDPRMLLLVREREDLDARIGMRARAMLDQGLLEEVAGLLAAGLTAGSPGLEAIGYGDFALALEGRITRDEAIERFVLRTRQYARRQIIWFRNRYRGVTEIAIAADEPPEATARRCLRQLRGEA